MIPANLQVMLTLALAGVMITTMLYLSFTIPIKLVLKFRMSCASVIASICMTWATMLFLLAPLLLVIPPESLENRWVTGFFMLVLLVIYTGLLYLFQPDSLHKMMVKQLKERSLQKNLYLLDFYKKEWLEATRSKNTKEVKRLDVEIAKLQDDRKAIKRQYSNFQWLYKLFERKNDLTDDAKS